MLMFILIMNIFQVNCDGKGVEIDSLKGNKIELINVDKYVRNIVNELKLDGERNKNIILGLQKEVRENNEKIGKLIEKLNEKLIEKLNVKLNEKMQKMKSMIEKKFAKLKLDGERNKKSNGTLENKCEQQNEEMDNRFVNATEERENKEIDLMRNIDQMKNKQTEMTTMLNKIDQSMKGFEKKLLINQSKMNYGEFVWRIDQFNEKRKDPTQTNFFSNSFYTHKHGYKMRLGVRPIGISIVYNGPLYLKVWFYLMKGEFNDKLQWPFKYVVTLSLINQQTGLAHVSKTIQYDDWPGHLYWNKPNTEMNDGFRFYIIEMKELLTNASLTLNNQIVIKCSVYLPS